MFSEVAGLNGTSLKKPEQVVIEVTRQFATLSCGDLQKTLEHTS